MTETLDVKVTEQEKEHESGDVYYKVEATMMEPGALFAEDEEENIDDKIKDALSGLK